MLFNINNYVEIKLTQHGKDILKQKEDKIFTEYPSLKEYLYKYKVNNRGYIVTGDRKSTRLNSSHSGESRMPSSA